jgi:fumarylpyruvate hydrolase
VTSGATVSYPLHTQNFQPEVELVVAIGTGGSNIPVSRALNHVFGYAVGNDLTRRDLQLDARAAGRPWDVGKGFDESAGIGTVHPVAAVGHLRRGAIWLTVDGQLRQHADLADMIWDVPTIIAELSRFFVLRPGDLIFTGTPAGVAPIRPHQHVVAAIEGLDALELYVGEVSVGN